MPTEKFIPTWIENVPPGLLGREIVISTPTSWLCNLELLQPSMALLFGDDNIITFSQDLKVIFDGCTGKGTTIILYICMYDCREYSFYYSIFHSDVCSVLEHSNLTKNSTRKFIKKAKKGSTIYVFKRNDKLKKCIFLLKIKKAKIIFAKLGYWAMKGS